MNVLVAETSARSATRSRHRAFPIQRDRRTAALGLLMLSALLLLFLRRPDAFLNPQFYAEDGRVFFMHARELGFASIFKPYNGAYYFLHRAIAYVGSFLSVGFVPHFYTLAALASVLAIVAYIARCRIDCRYKPLLALAVVAVPTNGEMFMTLVNLHWVVCLGLLVLLISDDARRRRELVADSALAIPLGLTGPFSLLWLPLFAVRAAVRRSRASVCLLAAVAMGAGVQFWFLDSRRSAGVFQLLDQDWLGYFGNGISGVLFLGLRFAKEVPNSLILAFLSLALYGGLTAHALKRRDGRRLLLLAAGMAVLASTAIAYRLAPEYLSRHIGNRYGYVPTVALVWVLILTLESADKVARAAAIVLGITAIASLTKYQAKPFVDYNWRQASLAIGGPEPVRVPINPPGWAITYFPKDGDNGMAASRVPIDPPIVLEEGSDVAKASQTFTFARRVFVYGVRFFFRPRSQKEEMAEFHVQWMRSSPDAGGRTEELAPIKLRPGNVREFTAWVFDSIREFRITGIRRSESWAIDGVLLLVKAEDADAGSGLARVSTSERPSWLPLAADWNGDGVESVGLFDPSSGKFFLSDRNTAGDADRVLTARRHRYGLVPLAGDWEGRGTAEPAVYDPERGIFRLQPVTRKRSPSQTLRLGKSNAGWLPLAGDWDGDGRETIGLFDPATSAFYLFAANDQKAGAEAIRFGRGGTGCLPVVGDWNGDGIDTIGLYEPSRRRFHLRNTNTSGPAERTITFGPSTGGCIPVAGDWDGDGIDTVGLYHPDWGVFMLDEDGDAESAAIEFRYGPRRSAPAQVGSVSLGPVKPIRE